MARPCRIFTGLPDPPRTAALYRSLTAVCTGPGCQVPETRPGLGRVDRYEGRASARRPGQDRVPSLSRSAAGSADRGGDLPLHGGHQLRPVAFELFGRWCSDSPSGRCRDSPGPDLDRDHPRRAGLVAVDRRRDQPQPRAGAHVIASPRRVLLLRRGQLDGLHARRPDVTTDELYAVGRPSPWSPGPSRTCSTSCRSCSRAASPPQCIGQAADLDGTAVLELHRPVQHRAVRRRADHPARPSVVMIEQLAGLAYVALFVSRLVGLTISRQMNDRRRRRSPTRRSSRLASAEIEPDHGTDHRDRRRGETCRRGPGRNVGQPARRPPLLGQTRVGHGERRGVLGHPVLINSAVINGRVARPIMITNVVFVRARAAQSSVEPQSPGGTCPEITVKPWVSARWVSGSPPKPVRPAPRRPRGSP